MKNVPKRTTNPYYSDTVFGPWNIVMFGDCKKKSSDEGMPNWKKTDIQVIITYN